MVVLGVEPGSTHYIRYKYQYDETNSLYNNNTQGTSSSYEILVWKHEYQIQKNRNLKGNRNNRSVSLGNEILWWLLKYSSTYGGHKYFSTYSCCSFLTDLKGKIEMQ